MRFSSVNNLHHPLPSNERERARASET